MHARGTLFIVSAPSGAGKTSLVNRLVSEQMQVCISVSHTTRGKRPAEEDGKDYHFVDQATFVQMVKDDCFLEHAKVFDNYYGTSKDWVEQTLTTGQDVILEIDWQGAVQVRRLVPQAVTVFVLPPSMAALEARLKARQSDSDEVIARRIAGAKAEISHYVEFDYLIVNDDFETALRELSAVVLSQRLQAAKQQQKLQTLLQGLL